MGKYYHPTVMLDVRHHVPYQLLSGDRLTTGSMNIYELFPSLYCKDLDQILLGGNSHVMSYVQVSACFFNLSVNPFPH